MSEPLPFLNSVQVGRALDILYQLPDNCIDVTVTSPPYNKQESTFGWLVRTDRYSHYQDRQPESAYQAWQVDVLDELCRVTKPGGSLFYNHKTRWVDGKMFHPLEWILRSSWSLRQEIIWDRTLAANVRGWRFWQVDERIYWLYKPIDKHLVGQELESCHAKMGSIWRMKPVARNENHPAPFPLELPLRAIYSMPGVGRKAILDPFCGAGTTLVAAKLLGHDYFGVDIAPDYVSYSRERIENCEVEREEAEAEKNKHVVKDPFQNRKKRGTVKWPFAPPHVNGDREEHSDLFERGKRTEGDE